MASNISQSFNQDSSGDINVGNISGTVSLPTGAATSSLQTTANTYLSSIATTPAPPQDIIATGTLTGLSSVVSLVLEGSSSCTVDVSGSGFVGTIVVQLITLSQSRTLSALALNSSAATGNITTNGSYRIFGIGGGGTLQVLFTSYTSGSANIGIRASTGTFYVNPMNFNASNNLTSSWLSDGSGNIIESINNQLETRDVLNVSSQYRAQSVTTTAAEALGGSTILVNRKLLHITPTNGIIYWGYNNSVTSTTGTPIFPNNTLFLSVTDNVHIYLIGTATTDCRIGEVS